MLGLLTRKATRQATCSIGSELIWLGVTHPHLSNMHLSLIGKNVEPSDLNVPWKIHNQVKFISGHIKQWKRPAPQLSLILSPDLATYHGISMPPIDDEQSLSQAVLWRAAQEAGRPREEILCGHYTCTSDQGMSRTIAVLVDRAPLDQLVTGLGKADIQVDSIEDHTGRLVRMLIADDQESRDEPWMVFDLGLMKSALMLCQGQDIVYAHTFHIGRQRLRLRARAIDDRNRHAPDQADSRREEHPHPQPAVAGFADDLAHELLPVFHHLTQHGFNIGPRTEVLLSGGGWDHPALTDRLDRVCPVSVRSLTDRLSPRIEHTTLETLGDIKPGSASDWIAVSDIPASTGDKPLTREVA